MKQVKLDLKQIKILNSFDFLKNNECSILFRSFWLYSRAFWLLAFLLFVKAKRILAEKLKEASWIILEKEEKKEEENEEQKLQDAGDQSSKELISN